MQYAVCRRKRKMHACSCSVIFIQPQQKEREINMEKQTKRNNHLLTSELLRFELRDVNLFDPPARKWKTTNLLLQIIKNQLMIPGVESVTTWKLLRIIHFHVLHMRE